MTFSTYHHNQYTFIFSFLANIQLVRFKTKIEYPMKLVLIYFTVLTILNCVESKVVDKYFDKNGLQSAEESVFLTKFDFGPNGGNIRIVVMQQLSIILGIDNYQLKPNVSYPSTSSSTTTSPSTFNPLVNHVHNIASQNKRYAYSQDRPPIQQDFLQSLRIGSTLFTFTLKIAKNPKEELNLQVTLMNEGSHFGEDDKVILGYILLVIVWLMMTGYFFKTIGDVFLYSKDQTKVVAFTGLIIIGIGYIYRLIHLCLYWSNGEGLHFFEILYVIIKTGCQFVIVTFIVSISWGWSVTHLKHDSTYLVAGLTSAILNTAGLIVSVSTEQLAEVHHKYDSAAGNVLLALRATLFLVFFIGIVRTWNLSVGNIRKFIKKFALIGGAYLAIWPLAVVIAELFLPNYMHNEVITFVEEITHLIASGMLCQILANPESTYRKVSLKEQDNPLSMNNYKRK